jgi:glycosyltransferase involved in cell wall biosynthesis
MKVSIPMITYNHERYISQAIESALAQQTSFDYEIVIGEDCSTDRTRDIVIGYQQSYPGKIRLLLPEQNLGGNRNFVRTLQACQGQYVAMLEGDDYWTSPHKLQRQAEFLDGHPECAICFHSTRIIYEDSSREPHVFAPPERKGIYQLEDLVQGNFMGTCSVMFRKGLFGDFPDWFFKLPIGDWSLHILNAQHGDIGYIDEVMGVYRKHSNGITSLRTPAEALQVHIDFYDRINRLLNYRFDRLIRRTIAKRWESTADSIAAIALQQGSLQAAQDTLMEIFGQWPAGLALPDSQKSRITGRMYALFAFAGYQADDLTRVRYCMPRAVGHDPALLRNLGVWSIGLEAFLGRRVASWLRRMANLSRSVKRRSLPLSEIQR